MKRGTVNKWLRELRDETGITTYHAHLGAAKGTAKYQEKDLFDKDYAGETCVYRDPVEFAKFFEEKVLKVDLSEDISVGLKHALTSHIKDELPREAVEWLRKKYVGE